MYNDQRQSKTCLQTVQQVLDKPYMSRDVYLSCLISIVTGTLVTVNSANKDFVDILLKEVNEELSRKYIRMV